MSYEAVDFQESEIHRLTSNIAAIEGLFPDSWNASNDAPPQATWADRMGLVHQLDDQWNYIEQPEIERPPPAQLDAPLAPMPIPPPREISIATIQALFPNLWAQFYVVPVPVAWYNGIQDVRIVDWPIANVGAAAVDYNEEDYADSESDWDEDNEVEYEWESDSGIDSLSEASDDSFDDSWSDASSVSSMREPSPNEYLRRLEEFEELQRYMYRDCPYCEMQRQYICRVYQINDRHHRDNNHQRPW